MSPAKVDDRLIRVGEGVGKTKRTVESGGVFVIDPTCNSSELREIIVQVNALALGKREMAGFGSS